MRIFAVLGQGAFPADMLRYDECWPLDTTSALAVLGNSNKLRLITMATGRANPTNDRWASFGWYVVEDEQRRGLSEILAP